MKSHRVMTHVMTKNVLPMKNCEGTKSATSQISCGGGHVDFASQWVLQNRAPQRLLAEAKQFRIVAELSELEKEYDYTIEYDDGSEFVHIFFANVIDFENPSYIRFDPVYEWAKDVDREVEGETVVIPFLRILRIVKRKPD